MPVPQSARGVIPWKHAPVVSREPECEPAPSGVAAGISGMALRRPGGSGVVIMNVRFGTGRDAMGRDALGHVRERHKPSPVVYLSPVHHHRLRRNRNSVVNRLLYWADRAREQGRERRANHLIELAWTVYDL